MTINLIPRSRIGALNIGSADIGTAGLPVSSLNAYSPAGTAQDGWYLTWSAGYNSWVPTPAPSYLPSFVDGEVPVGTKNTLNRTFYLSKSPVTTPSSNNSSLQLYMGGQLMSPGSAGDYIVSGTVVTFTGNGSLPGPNDNLLAYYRA